LSSEEAVPVRKPSGPSIIVADDEWPLLPDINFSKAKLTDLKTLLRGYLTKCYQNSTGDPKAKIPWGQLQQTPDKFLDSTANYLPAGTGLLDPSHIRQSDLMAILRHLKERQDAKEIKVVFEFMSSAPYRRNMQTRRRLSIQSPITERSSSHTPTRGGSPAASQPDEDEAHPVPPSPEPSPTIQHAVKKGCACQRNFNITHTVVSATQAIKEV
jgi:hypothetical protein